MSVFKAQAHTGNPIGIAERGILMPEQARSLHVNIYVRFLRLKQALVFM
jgi:hypothetical protein